MFHFGKSAFFSFTTEFICRKKKNSTPSIFLPQSLYFWMKRLVSPRRIALAYISILLQLADAASVNSIKRSERHLWFHHCSAQHYQAAVSCCCCLSVCVCAHTCACTVRLCIWWMDCINILMCAILCVCVSFFPSLALISVTAIIQLDLIKMKWIVSKNGRVMCKSPAGAPWNWQQSGLNLCLHKLRQRSVIHSVHFVN